MWVRGLSTIVEIIEAYQPVPSGTPFVITSTIVEIIEAYQPLRTQRWISKIYNSRNYRSLLARFLGQLQGTIYNSRNYRSLLAGIGKPTLSKNLQQQKLLKLTSHRIRRVTGHYLQQQKLLKLTSRFDGHICFLIYNSRNY